MAHIFLDANIVMDVVLNRQPHAIDFRNDAVYVSPLSLHILNYSEANKMPSQDLVDFLDWIIIVDLDLRVVRRALLGPTKDFEDNVQLYSADFSDCDYFLTQDKQLLKRKHFGMVQLVDKIPTR